MLSIFVEKEGDDRHQSSHSPNQASSSPDAHSREHLICEKGCCSTTGGAGDGVGSDGGGCIHQIHVDQVVQVCDKDKEQRAREKAPSEGWDDPMDITASTKSVFGNMAGEMA